MIADLVSILFDDKLHGRIEAAFRVARFHLSFLRFGFSATVHEAIVDEWHQTLSCTNHIELYLRIEEGDLTMLNIEGPRFSTLVVLQSFRIRMLDLRLLLDIDVMVIIRCLR